jgi:hypothetical protein
MHVNVDQLMPDCFWVRAANSSYNPLIVR